MLADKVRILIVLTGSLGDVVRGLSVVDAIKAAKPESNISWVIDDKWHSVLSLHPRIDHIIVFERKQGVKGVLKLWKDLRLKEYDICLDLQRHFKSGLISWRSGAARRIGFNRLNCKEFNYLFNNERIDYFPDSLAKLDHYHKFLEYLGLDSTEELSFGFEDLDPYETIPDLLGVLGGPFIGIVLGSSWESKDWLPSGYQQLLIQLQNSYSCPIVLVGDPSQKPLADQLMSSMSETSSRVHNYVAKTSLRDLVSLIKYAKLCIGPDSGPGHIAAAVGTPYVSLFGPTPPERVAPYNNEHLVVRSDVGCMPCYRKHCPGLNRLCMRLISASQVMSTVKQVLPPAQVANA